MINTRTPNGLICNVVLKSADEIFMLSQAGI